MKHYFVLTLGSDTLARGSLEYDPNSYVIPKPNRLLNLPELTKKASTSLSPRGLQEWQGQIHPCQCRGDYDAKEETYLRECAVYSRVDRPRYFAEVHRGLPVQLKKYSSRLLNHSHEISLRSSYYVRCHVHVLVHFFCCDKICSLIFINGLVHNFRLGAWFVGFFIISFKFSFVLFPSVLFAEKKFGQQVLLKKYGGSRNWTADLLIKRQRC